jgi:predicted DsbA family dithiol-disulfide isomerase
MATVALRDVDGPSPRTSPEGAVVVDWWCDLACSDSAASLEVLDELRDRFGDAVEVRLRHFPLTEHVWAVAAAQCHVAVSAQGRGEAYAAHALATIDTIEGPADYVDLAEFLGADSDEVAAALFDGRHASEVRDDHDAGRALGVAGTPTFVVDGLMIDASGTLDGTLEALAARIDRARSAS